MNSQLKELYIHMLKYKWIPKNQSMGFWKDNPKLGFCYFVDLIIPNKVDSKKCFYLVSKR